MVARVLEHNPIVEFDPNDPVILSQRRYNRPRAYSGWSANKKIEYTFGCSLDNIELVMAWDPNTLDPNQLRIWKEVTIAMLNIGAKIGLSRAHAQNSRALAEIKAGLAARNSGSNGGTYGATLTESNKINTIDGE